MHASLRHAVIETPPIEETRAHMLWQRQAGKENVTGNEIRPSVRTGASWAFLREAAGFFLAAAVNNNLQALFQQVAGKAAAHGTGTPESDFHEFFSIRIRGRYPVKGNKN